MSRADVLELVQNLSALQSNDTEASRYYDEVVRDLGHYEILTSVERRSYDTGDAGIYQMSTDAIRILELAWNHRRLDRTNEITLRSAFGASWAQRRGEPVAVTEANVSMGLMQLAPTPLHNGDIDVVRTEMRENLPYWLELPVALLILGREFMRESNHQDLKFAKAASELGTLFLQILGIRTVASQQRQQEQS